VTSSRFTVRPAGKSVGRCHQTAPALTVFSKQLGTSPAIPEGRDDLAARADGLTSTFDDLINDRFTPALTVAAQRRIDGAGIG